MFLYNSLCCSIQYFICNVLCKTLIIKKHNYISLFPYKKASAPEELTLQDGDEVDFLENLGDGWCKARNKYGKVGFVPESYIEIRPKAPSTTGSVCGVGDDLQHFNKSSASSPANSTVSDAWQVSVDSLGPQQVSPSEVDATPAYGEL